MSRSLQKRTLFLMLGILLLGTVMRAWVHHDLESKSPYYYRIPTGTDQVVYLRQARELNAGLWPGEQPYVYSPYYAYFLGYSFRIFGDSNTMPRLVQIFFGLITIALTYKLGLWVFGRKVGLAAAFVLAIYPPSLFYDLEFTNAPHGTLYIMAALCLALLYKKKGQLLYLLLAGIFLGVASTGQPNTLIIAPAISLWLLFTERNFWRWFKSSAVIAVGACLIIAIPTWHNYQVTDQLHVIRKSEDTYRNLYAGNHPLIERNRSFYTVWRRYITLPDLKLPVDEYTLEMTTSGIKEAPDAWFVLKVQDVILFLVGSDKELGDLLNFYYWGEVYSAPLKYIPLRIEMLSLMMLMSPRLIWNRKAALLYLSYVLYLLGVMIFFSVSRFRMPIVPILILCSVAFAFDIHRRYKSGDKAVLMLPIGLAIAMAAIMLRYYTQDVSFAFY